ncbi:MAG: methyltransferase domain-containing protein [bacterium]|nr:methyltransferase domain-containing protein [bacterium]
MDDLLRQQRRYMDEEWAPSPWMDRRLLTPMADYAWHSSLLAARAHLPDDLAGISMLILSCGQGVDTHFFQVEGADAITVTDISPRVLDVASERCPGIRGVIADTEHLPFKDGAFDIVGVRSGLHHLRDPYAGLRDMARVARAAFFFIEHHQTGLTPLLVRLGVLEDKEEEGNEVYRFVREEVADVLKSLGVARYTIQTAWFLQVPPILHLSKRIPGRWAAGLLRGFVRLFNGLFWRTGNCIVTVAHRVRREE